MPAGGSGPAEELPASISSAPRLCSSRSLPILASKCRRKLAALICPASSSALLASRCFSSSVAPESGGLGLGTDGYRSGKPCFATADRRKPSAWAEKLPSSRRSVRYLPREASKDCSLVRSVSNAYRTGSQDWDGNRPAPPLPAAPTKAPPEAWHSTPRGNSSASPGRSSGVRSGPGRGADTGRPATGRRTVSLCSPQSCSISWSDSVRIGGPRLSGGSSTSLAVT
mmetsp:Transcript_62483/g.182646  ORF Transcript_62483/g.182646 Transcript_62483/m.182646 type:complete len:226 (+) Transcript_62483:310-987(+)